MQSAPLGIHPEPWTLGKVEKEGQSCTELRPSAHQGVKQVSFCRVTALMSIVLFFYSVFFSISFQMKPIAFLYFLETLNILRRLGDLVG